MPETICYDTPMPIPTRPYVALYGSHGENWREGVAWHLSQHGIAFYDPTNKAAWDRITEETGDERQAEVDALVLVQRKAMLGAAAVVFYLSGATTGSPAARFELGMLHMCAIPVFLHVAPTTAGRNYVRAQAQLSPNIVSCPTLRGAAEAAAVWFNQRHPRGD